ncbi:MAG: glycosyltransferase [Ktedonobacterales bacterium]
MNNHEIAAEIADMLSWDGDSTLRQVESEAAQPGSHVVNAWREKNPSSDDEIEHFYSDAESYIFDLMREAASEIRCQWRAAVVGALSQHWGRATDARVLDYGAGVGSDTLYFAERCRSAFYYDVPGVISKFALKRFAQHKVPITCITNTGAYDAEFDALVAFDVLEHLVNPLAHLDEMVRLTKLGGLLFLTESFEQLGESYPFHLTRNASLAGKLDALMNERGCRPVAVLEGCIHVYVKGPPVAVIVPVYNAYDHVVRLLDSINHTTAGYPVRWMLMNDASPDSRIVPVLNEFVASFGGQCQVVDSVDNRGFSQTCNAAMADTGGDDVILLNSDTIVYDGWVRRLLEAAYEDPNIGTATPLSNNASCYSMFEYVTPSNHLNEMLAELERPSLPIPVGVGFCLYIKRKVLDRVGLFDPIFGRGYGEETDLCLRAATAGYRHVLATRVFVYHAGSASMIAASVVRQGETTLEEHERIINQRYPRFVPAVHDFIGSRVIEALANDLSKHYIVQESAHRPSIAFVSHDDVFFGEFVGGTAYHIRDLIRELERDYVYYVISSVASNFPVTTPEWGKIRVTCYIDGIVQTSVPLVDDYAAMLVELNPSVVHIHHLMYLPPSLVTALIEWHGQKIFTIHDFYGVCPQYYLLNYQQTYCGVPEPDECGRCAKKLLGTGYSTVAAQRRTFQRLVDSVSTVLAPSNAALAVFRKAISIPEVKARIIPHPIVAYSYDPTAKHLFAPTPIAQPSILGQMMSDHSGPSTLADNTHNGEEPSVKTMVEPAEEARAGSRSLLKLKPSRLRVAFIGYDAPQKGSTLIQGIVDGCLDDPITFVSIGDIGKAAEGRENIVFTGRYSREEVTGLIKQYEVDAVIVPSLWPETYCYTLSEAWMAGVPAIVGPHGAQAERVAETGAGFVVPDYRVQSFVDAVHKLMNDKDCLTTLKQATAAVSMRQDYGEYVELYRQHINREPRATHFFSSHMEQAVMKGNATVRKNRVVTRLVVVRKLVFPVGSTREKGYLWIHDRLIHKRPVRSYVGGLLQKDTWTRLTE